MAALGRRDERPVLQRDQLRHGPAARRDRFLPPRSSAAWATSTAPSSAASCSPPCRPSGAVALPVRQRLQGRVRLRRGHRPHGLEAHRPDRREDRASGYDSRPIVSPSGPLPPALAGIAALVAVRRAVPARREPERGIGAARWRGRRGGLLSARFGWTSRDGRRAVPPARVARCWLAVLLGVLVVVAWFHDDHFPLLMLATVLLYVAVCLGLNLQFGYAGVVNFAGAAFFGIGGYTAAVLAKHTPLPHLLVLPLGGLMAAVIGSLLILPVLRTRGHYAAARHHRLRHPVQDLPRGERHARRAAGPEDPGHGASSAGSLNDRIEIGDLEISFYVNLRAAALPCRRRLRRWCGGSSAPGSACAWTRCGSTRPPPPPSASTSRAGRSLAFTLGNFLAGIAGALYAMMTGFVAPNNFTFGDSLILVSIVILGGIGNLWGVGGRQRRSCVILPEKLQFIQEYRFLLYAGAGDPDPAVPAAGPAAAPDAQLSPGEAGHRHERAAAPPIGLTRRFGGLVALDAARPRGARGRDPRPDRPERLGQDHLLQRHHRHLSGQRRHDHVRRATTSPAARPQAIYRAGITRTFQRSRLCLPLSVFDNIMIGNYKRLDHGSVVQPVAARRVPPRVRGASRRRRATCCGSSTRRSPTGCSSRWPALPMIDRRRIEICRALISAAAAAAARRTVGRHDPRRDPRADGRHPVGARPPRRTSPSSSSSTR